MSLNDSRSDDARGIADVPRSKPVDPHALLLEIKERLRLDGHEVGPWYDHPAALKATESLLGALDVQSRTLAESNAAARRAAGLAEAPR